MSLCPSASYPIPKMMMGVTAMMVMMTTEAKMSRVMVASERQLMRVLDFISTAQLFLTFSMLLNLSDLINVGF
jgi:hypothetical protein